MKKKWMALLLAGLLAFPQATAIGAGDFTGGEDVEEEFFSSVNDDADVLDSFGAIDQERVQDTGTIVIQSPPEIVDVHVPEEGTYFRTGDTLSFDFTIENQIEKPDEIDIYFNPESLMGNLTASINFNYEKNTDSYVTTYESGDIFSENTVKLDENKAVFTFSGVLKENDYYQLQFPSFFNVYFGKTRLSSSQYRTVYIDDDCADNNHSVLSDQEPVVDKRASCEEPGSQSLHCIKCDAIIEESVQEIPALEHNWQINLKNGDCINGGEIEYYCNNCDEYKYEEIPAVGEHTWSEWYEVEDDRQRKCEVCGATENESTSAIRAPYIPDISECSVTGLENPLTFAPNQYHRFIAAGVSAKSEYPESVKGDGLWLPAYWSFDEAGHESETNWKLGSPEGIEPGTHDLYVWYQLYKWNGDDWVATAKFDKIQVRFESAEIPVTPTVTPTPTVIPEPVLTPIAVPTPTATPVVTPTATPIPAPPITAPDQVTGIKSTIHPNDGTISLSFHPVPGAEEYFIYCRMAGTENWYRTTSHKGTTYTLSGLSKGEAYDIRVRAGKRVDGKWLYGKPSKVIRRWLETVSSKRKVGKEKLTVEITRPLPYASSSIETDGTVTAIQDGPSEFALFYSTDPEMAGDKKVTFKAIKKTVKGLKSGKTYFVRVRAYKEINGKKYTGALSGIRGVKVK